MYVATILKHKITRLNAFSLRKWMHVILSPRHLCILSGLQAQTCFRQLQFELGLLAIQENPGIVIQSIKSAVRFVASAGQVLISRYNFSEASLTADFFVETSTSKGNRHFSIRDVIKCQAKEFMF